MTIRNIFDGLSHPSLTQLKVFNSNRSLPTYSKSITKALAVTLPNTDGFSDRVAYVQEALKSKHFYPVVHIDPRAESVSYEVSRFHNLGCVGFKIHPRFLDWDWTADEQYLFLQTVASQIEKVGSTLFFCTYFSSKASTFPKQDPLFLFAQLVSDHPTLQVVLLHAGGNRLLDYIEFARFNKNILLDLSYSSVKFLGSSYVYDLQYALKNFDERVSFGSDWPYIGHSDAISAISSNILGEKKYPIGEHPVWGRNLQNFMKL